MRRWKKNTKMMIGIVSSTAAAAIETVAVCERSVEVSESANRKSFQQNMNTRMAVVNTPGAASGTITDRNACSGVAPSILAAFSSSHGISRKNAESV